VSLRIVSGAARPRRLNQLPNLKVKPPQNFWTAMPASVQVSGCLPWLGHPRAPGRRSESVDARNRGVQGAAAAATYQRAMGI